MKIFIRTTGERSLDQFNNISYEVLLDKERTGCKGYFNQLKQLSSYNDDVLILEDDIKLKSNFFRVLEDMIEISGNKYIINMSQPTASVRLFEPKEFFWTRAVYYPKGSIKEFMNNYSDDCLEISKYYDVIQQYLMINKYLGIPSIMTIVDLDCKSLMNYK